MMLRSTNKFQFILVILIAAIFLAACDELEALNNNEEAKETETDNGYTKVTADFERVVDGDTIIVNLNGEEESIRLLLIDTPESVHPDEPTQPYGEESSEFAEEYFDDVDEVELEIGQEERGKYGRLLAHVFVDDENFNKVMVEKGYARVAFVQEPNTKYIDEFNEAEEEAKEDNKKIWSIDDYVTDRGFNVE